MGSPLTLCEHDVRDCIQAIPRFLGISPCGITHDPHSCDEGGGVEIPFPLSPGFNGFISQELESPLTIKPTNKPTNKPGWHRRNCGCPIFPIHSNRPGQLKCWSDGVFDCVWWVRIGEWCGWCPSYFPSVCMQSAIRSRDSSIASGKLPILRQGNMVRWCGWRNSKKVIFSKTMPR